MSTNKNTELTPQEEKFCDLFVNGGVGFAGQSLKCYMKAFSVELNINALDCKGEMQLISNKLKNRPQIKEKIKEIAELNIFEDETIAVKLQVTESLKSIIAEASTDKYKDKYGLSVSPAPLRAVAVNASKALAELYPIKHSQDSGKQQNANQQGVTFNVIVPSSAPASVQITQQTKE